MYKLKMLLLICTLCTSGCYVVHLKNADGVIVNSSDGNQPEKIKKHILWWGKLSEISVSTDKCVNSGFAKITVRSNFLGSMVNVLTLGFYRPVTIEYYCNEPCN